jgi:hypothetical protein
MVHPSRALPQMELAGLDVALGEWTMNVKAQDFTVYY